MEWNTKLSFVTEIKGLATALDAFCLSNFHSIKGKSVPIPKAVAVLKTLGEDLPQLTIQILYIAFYAGWESNTFNAVALPLISSAFSFMFSIATAITASSCPIDIENVKN